MGVLPSPKTRLHAKIGHYKHPVFAVLAVFAPCVRANLGVANINTSVYDIANSSSAGGQAPYNPQPSQGQKAHGILSLFG